MQSLEATARSSAKAAKEEAARLRRLQVRGCMCYKFVRYTCYIVYLYVCIHIKIYTCVCQQKRRCPTAPSSGAGTYVLYICVCVIYL